jgi:hypothetical protein
MTITQAELKRQLSYSPATGIFHWLVEKNSHGGKIHPGQTAGHLKDNGYIIIGVNGRIYRAHRLAWLYMTGEWPTDMIDHRNRVRSDNRWKNLRVSSASLNGQNMLKAHSDSATGLLGVCYHKQTGKYVAGIKAPGKERKYLGLFSDPTLAHRVYVKAKRQLHAACPEELR